MPGTSENHFINKIFQIWIIIYHLKQNLMLINKYKITICKSFFFFYYSLRTWSSQPVGVSQSGGQAHVTDLKVTSQE